MEPFTTHTGLVATLNRANVDTDQIIPKQFLKSIKRTGFGPSAFFDWRYDEKANPDPSFELNHPRFDGRSILVTRNNFGCGSSREHAVWALHQDGYNVIVAPRIGEGDAEVPGFADIFRNNSFKNGLLTIELTNCQVDEIMDLVEANEGLTATADLPNQELVLHVEGAEKRYGFEIDPGIKNQLVQGLDDIDQSLKSVDAIDTFETKHDNQLAEVIL